MRSIISVLLGLLLALVLAALVVFGVLAPVMSVVFGLGDVMTSALFPSVFLLFAAAFAFYFGGMAAGYRASSSRSLHGAMVGVVACVLSPAYNLLTGQGAFPRIDSAFSAGLIVAFAVVTIAASYVGGGRGEALYEHNRSAGRTKAPVRRGRKTESESSTEPDEGKGVGRSEGG